MPTPEVVEMPKLDGHKTSLTPVTVNDETFYVEVAKNDQEREKGLMDRKSMAADEGMLFIFEEMDQHNFWMKNTLIPLDMVWIDGNKTVVDIQAAEPCSSMPCAIYRPEGESKYVLEVLQGRFLGNVGDQVNF